MKNILIGLALAVISALFFKNSTLGIFLFLVGISIAGFFGTLLIIVFLLLGLPFASIFTQVTIKLLFFQIPILYIWIALDLISIPLGLFSLGLGSIVIAAIKIGILIFFGHSAFSELFKF